MFLSTHN
jgi:hypothetical protein